jgi:hypothetical protein
LKHQLHPLQRVHLVHGSKAKTNKTMLAMHPRDLNSNVIIVISLDTSREIVGKDNMTWQVVKRNQDMQMLLKEMKKKQQCDFAFVASQNQSTKSTTWYFDLGASRHYTCHKDWYVNFIEDKSHSESVSLGDDWTYYIRGCGDVRVILNNTLSYTFKNV